MEDNLKTNENDEIKEKKGNNEIKTEDINENEDNINDEECNNLLIDKDKNENENIISLLFK